ncbi:MAG: hypothetical protein J6Y89_06665 [Lachnospiraceae bacterium]|nr:hypothetical protein [Lachnospiraceae bacterium]
MYIKDVRSGEIRLYGEDPHDSLKISKDGRTLSYYNLHCAEGSEYGDYRFCVDRDGNVPEEDEILSAHGADAYFNIGGCYLKSDVEDAFSALERFVKESSLDIHHVDIGKGTGYIRAEKVIEKLHEQLEKIRKGGDD